MTALGSMRWVALALVGLAVAAGVSVAASQLVSQRIGLAAETPSAGRDLAPAGDQHGPAGHGKGTRSDPGHRGHRPGSTTTASTTTVTTPTTTTATTTTTAPATTTPTTTPPPASGGGGSGETPDD